MAYSTLTEITQSVVSTIGLVAGTSVQTYTEPQIKAAVQQIFDFLFRKRKWAHLTTIETMVLDGATGVVTTDLTSKIKEFQHIQSIHLADTDILIPQPSNKEHLYVDGGDPLFWKPLPWTDPRFFTRVIKFYPIDAVGSVDIVYKIRPNDFTDDSKIPFPKDLMIYGTAWRILDVDGINPGHAATMQGLFDAVYADYVSEISNTEIGLGGRRRNDSFTIS